MFSPQIAYHSRKPVSNRNGLHRHQSEPWGSVNADHVPKTFRRHLHLERALAAHCLHFVRNCPTCHCFFQLQSASRVQCRPATVLRIKQCPYSHSSAISFIHTVMSFLLFICPDWCQFTSYIRLHGSQFIIMNRTKLNILLLWREFSQNKTSSSNPLSCEYGTYAQELIHNLEYWFCPNVK